MRFREKIDLSVKCNPRFTAKCNRRRMVELM